MAADAQSANHYVFDGRGMTGTVDTTSIAGTPVASVTVDGVDATNVGVQHAPGLGVMVRGDLSAIADGPSRAVTVVVPEVNVSAEPEPFWGLAVIVTTQSSIGGPALVQGAIQSYDPREVSGTASAVMS
jgi:hypothetical protein